MPDNMFLIILGVIGVLLLIYIIVIFNKLIKLSHLVKEAFSTMDVYLKKRWDLIPNIVETVKNYANYEKNAINDLINLRNDNYEKMSLNEKVDINKIVSPCVSRLIALAESYPDLKANENYINLSNTLTQIENDIANARKYYNGSVRKYNNLVDMFPSNLIAKLFRFKRQEMFEIETDERQNVHVDM